MSDATPCPAPFAPRLVSWEARQAAQAAWMRERLDAGKAGVFVNNAEPSVSKTGAMLALMRDRPDKRFVYFAPSHALLADVRRRAIEAGIPAGDLAIAQGLDRLCDADHKALVLADAAQGLDVRARWCRPDAGRCGRAETCAWHVQREAGAAARILLAPAAYLARDSHFGFLLSPSWGNDRRDAIVIDEDASGFLSVRRDVDAAGLAAWRAQLAEAGDGAYVRAQRALADALAAFLAAPGPERLALRLPQPDAAGWRGDRARLRETSEARALALGELDPLPAFEALLREALAAPGLVFHRTRLDAARTSRPVPVLPRKPVFLLDGTAVPAYYDRLLRQEEGLAYFLPPAPPAARDYIPPAGRLIQVVDGGFSRARLRQARPFARIAAVLRAFVEARRKRDPGRRTLLVTYMDQRETPYEGRFRAALADLGVQVAHFGAIRGLDGFAGWDVLVVGTFRLDPAAYLADAREALGAEPEDLGAEPVPQVLATAGASSYEVDAPRFRDPALQAAFEQKTLAEVVQAIARSRVLVPGHADAAVAVFSDFPLPGLLVEPLRLAELEAELGLGDRPAAPDPLDAKAVRSALAEALADGAADVPAAVARLLGAPLPAGHWRPDAPAVEVGPRWERELALQGVADPAERAALIARYGPVAAQVVGPFRVPTSQGLATLQAPVPAAAGVEAIVAAARRLRAGKEPA